VRLLLRNSGVTFAQPSGEPHEFVAKEYPLSMPLPSSQSHQPYRCLVTGGAGFIGSHVVEALLARGATVHVLDNFDPFYSRPEKEGHLSACRGNSSFSLIEGDIRDENLVRKLVRELQPSVIIHLAARAGVRPSLENPELYADVNVRGTAVLLEAARQMNVRNFVFASSSSVYGNTDRMPLRESDRTDQQVSPYGATKKAGELLCHTFHHVYGMNISCLRFFTVYGPRQRPDLAIRKFVQLALHDQEIPVYGDGSSSRDYTHIRDIVGGVLGAVQWGFGESPRYEIFNLGSSHPVRLRELLQAIEDQVGRPLRRATLPLQPGDVFQTYADTTKAERDLGFRHDVTFRDGMREFVQWMKMRESNVAVPK